MVKLKVLVIELISVDGLSSSSSSVREVATLEHEVRNDAVELEKEKRLTNTENNKTTQYLGSLVVQRLSALSSSLFSSAESAKVLGSLGHDVAKQTHHDASGRLSVCRDREGKISARLENTVDKKKNEPISTSKKTEEVI